MGLIQHYRRCVASLFQQVDIIRYPDIRVKIICRTVIAKNAWVPASTHHYLAIEIDPSWGIYSAEK